MNTTIDVQKYNRLLNQYGSGPCSLGHVQRSIDLLLLRGKKGRALDIGCGTGHWTAGLSMNGFEAHGIDIDLSVLQNIENSTAMFKEGDMHDIPYEDKYFDVIFNSGVFEHSIAPYVACCEMNRVLKIGGAAVLVLPTENNTRLIYMHQHVSIFNDAGYRNLFYKSGFVVTHSEVNYGSTDDEHYIYVIEKERDIQ